MKRLQAFFAVLSVITGICGALAFTPKHNYACTGTVYYYDGTNYVKKGTLTGTCQNNHPNEYCYYYDPTGTHTYVACPGFPVGQRFIPES